MAGPASGARPHGAHPVHIHPVRPLYRFAATGLGASMWFFVRSLPHLNAMVFTLTCPSVDVQSEKGTITSPSRSLYYPALTTTNSCNRTVRHFSAGSTLGTTEQFGQDTCQTRPYALPIVTTRRYTYTTRRAAQITTLQSHIPFDHPRTCSPRCCTRIL